MSEVLTGQVVSIATDGSLITDISAESLQHAPRDESISVSCDGHTTQGIFSPQHDQPELTLLAILGPDGYLKLTLVGESATAFLGIRTGAGVIVKW